MTTLSLIVNISPLTELIVPINSTVSFLSQKTTLHNTHKPSVKLPLHLTINNYSSHAQVTERSCLQQNHNGNLKPGQREGAGRKSNDFLTLIFLTLMEI